MVLSLALLFISCLVMSFFEERLKQRDKIIFCLLLGLGMICVAGMRAVGSTPDTDVYELMYYGKTNVILAKATEPTFTAIASVLNDMSLSVNALFFAYAIISVPIHFAAFWKLSKLPLLTITVYLSYYFMMHEMVQIRVGVAAGLFLLAVYYYVEKRKKMALLFILIAVSFHYSAAAGLIIFLLNDKISRWQKVILYSIIPVGLVIFIAHIDLSRIIPESIVGTKLAIYREMRDKGIEENQAGMPLKYNVLIWMNMVLYYICIIYKDFLTRHCKYVPIAIKLQAVGFFFLLYLSGVSAVLGSRMCDFFSIVSIILWTASVYAFSPLIVGKIVSNLISTFRFVTSIVAYALALLWMH